MLNLKQLQKQKYKALLFDGIQFESRLNIHPFHKEYDFIPEKSEFGTFSYVKSTLSFILVKNNLIANGTQALPIPMHNDVIISLSIPVYLHLLDDKLNIVSVEREDRNNPEARDEMIKLALGQNNAEHKAVIDKMKDKLNEFSFTFIEGQTINVWQWDNFRQQWCIPQVAEKDLPKLNSILSQKIKSLNIDLMECVLSGLTERDTLSHLLCEADFTQLPECHDLDTFLTFLKGNEVMTSSYYHASSKDEQFRKMVRDRFLSCVKKQFDASWVMQKFDAEMRRMKSSSGYRRHRGKVSKEFHEQFNELAKRFQGNNGEPLIIVD